MTYLKCCKTIQDFKILYWKKENRKRWTCNGFSALHVAHKICLQIYNGHKILVFKKIWRKVESWSLLCNWQYVRNEQYCLFYRVVLNSPTLYSDQQQLPFEHLNVRIPHNNSKTNNHALSLAKTVRDTRSCIVNNICLLRIYEIRFSNITYK